MTKRPGEAGLSRSRAGEDVDQQFFIASNRDNLRFGECSNMSLYVYERRDALRTGCSKCNNE